MRISAALATIAILLLVSPAFGHHSAARFDQESDVSIEGVIVKYQWSNPHVYLWVEEEMQGGEKVTWEIEGLPPAYFKRLGWSKDMIEVGDYIKVNGNPGRDPQAYIMLLSTIEKADKSEINMGREHVFAYFFQEKLDLFQTDSLNGTWLGIPGNALLIFLSADTIGTNEKGREAIESYNENVDNPGISCTPGTSPVGMFLPDLKQIDVRDSVVIIRSEFESIERTVYLNATSHEGAVESNQGYSIGHWEENTLVIDTSLFLPNRSGNSNPEIGLPSGSEKHLVERIELNEEGSHLTYSFVLEDPEYLESPISGEMQWAYQPNKGFNDQPCDLVNAQLFTQ